MNWHPMEKHWPLFQEHVKLRWSRLDDVNLNDIGGKRMALIAGLRHAYGITPEQAENEVQQFERNYER